MIINVPWSISSVPLHSLSTNDDDKAIEVQKLTKIKIIFATLLLPISI